MNPFCVRTELKVKLSFAPYCFMFLCFISLHICGSTDVAKEICGKSKIDEWVFLIQNHAVRPLQTGFILIGVVWQGLNQGQVDLWCCLVEMGWTGIQEHFWNTINDTLIVKKKKRKHIFLNDRRFAHDVLSAVIEMPLNVVTVLGWLGEGGMGKQPCWRTTHGVSVDVMGRGRCVLVCVWLQKASNNKVTCSERHSQSEKKLWMQPFYPANRSHAFFM